MTRTEQLLIAFLDWLASQDADAPENQDLSHQDLARKYLAQNGMVEREIGA